MFVGFEDKPHLDPEKLGFKTSFSEPFSIQYERRAMPDFGALEYAYTGLAEPFYPALGTGVPFGRKPIDPYQPAQAYQFQGVPTVGLWLEAGYMYNQALTDPQGTPFDYAAPGALPPQVAMNQPVDRFSEDTVVMNAAYPDRRLNWGQ